MKNWKEAIECSSNGLGCYDVRGRNSGYINVQNDSKGGFRIDGCLDNPIEARGIPAHGVDRVLEEINVDPRSGWFSNQPR